MKKMILLALCTALVLPALTATAQAAPLAHHQAVKPSAHAAKVHKNKKPTPPPKKKKAPKKHKVKTPPRP
ncbi:hypothetical protein AB7W30_02510 [Providencia manganoxydans]|uniref:hypothetical protein n=1 Tax=Providencia manganoxydans TaxID=2923283 RepID=UPI0029C00C2A|nr:hypothetical protein [Providencia manganoxydans]MDX4946159.1 hypothetical protein [Providencia manganoxydans]